MNTLPHLLSIDQYDERQMMKLFSDAEFIENALQKEQNFNLLSGKILAILFFQASSRTRFSFTSAMLRLGGQVFNFTPNQTRAWSGESLRDTAKMMNGYADAVILRHNDTKFLQEYVEASEIPVINAGVGGEEFGAEHPTQTLLDIYTIHKELGSLENLAILLIGNLKQRVSRTFIKAISQFPNVKLFLLSPGDCWMSPEDEKEYCKRGIKYQRVRSMEEVLEKVDVIYQSGSSYSFLESHTMPVPKEIHLNQKTLQKIRKETIILHPLPRQNGDLSIEVDDLHQAKYFAQAKNAVPVRMAILMQLFNKNPGLGVK